MPTQDHAYRVRRHTLLRTASLRLPLCLLSAGMLLDCDGTAPVEEPQEISEVTQPLNTVPLARILRTIDVTPTNSILVVDLNTKGSQTFTVTAHYMDGSTADVTSSATYVLGNTMLGTLAKGRFDSAVRTTEQVDLSTVTIHYHEGTKDATAVTKLTVAWLRTSGPTPDVVLTLPNDGSSPSTTTQLGTSVQALDAFFAIDTTGSMGGEINEVRRALDATILPAVQAAAKDAWVGVGAVEDFPTGAYGSPGCGGGTDDQPFILLSAMTGDFMGVKSAFDSLLHGSAPRGCGNDLPEGQFEALYQIATGKGNVVSGVVNIPAHHDKGRGGVEFRDGALPVITLVSDASFHTINEPARMCFGGKVDYGADVNMVAHGRSETTDALKSVCARVIGLSAETGAAADCVATGDMHQLATDTGALVPPVAWDATGMRPAGCAAGQCCTGLGGAGEAPNADGLCPLVMKIKTDGSGSGPGAADAISKLVHFAPVNVNLSKSGSAKGEDGSSLPAGKTTADFIVSVAAVDGMAPTMPAGLPAPVASGDHFTGVTPGSTLRFKVQAKNDFISATTKPQLFRAKVQTQASGCANLDQRDVLIIVPAK